MKDGKQFIICTVESLIEVLDARANIDIFVLKDDGTNERILSRKVYEVLNDTDFFNEYGRRCILGISRALNITNILI